MSVDDSKKKILKNVKIAKKQTNSEIIVFFYRIISLYTSIKTASNVFVSTMTKEWLDYENVIQRFYVYYSKNYHDGIAFFSWRLPIEHWRKGKAEQGKAEEGTGLGPEIQMTLHRSKGGKLTGKFDPSR